MSKKYFWILGACVLASSSVYVLAQSTTQPPNDTSGMAGMAGMPGMAQPAGQPSSKTPALERSFPALRTDLELKLGTPYIPDPKLPDDYRCFVLDPKLTADQFITGYQVIPGNTANVHHAIVTIATPDQFELIAKKNGKDGQDGWSCFGGAGLNANKMSQNQALEIVIKNGGLNKAAIEEILEKSGNILGLGIGSWTPGSTATLFPEGTAEPLRKGNLLVIQVHYNTLVSHAPDQTRLRLQLEGTQKNLTPLESMSLPAAVELPCATQNSSPECNRQTAYNSGIQKYGSRMGKLPDYLLTMCGKTLEDFAKQPANRVVSSCDRTFPKTALLEGVILHMHTRGVSTLLELNPDTPQAKVLLDIPKWDFHWQGSYWYQEPIALKRGDKIRITCIWDNTLEGNNRYIVWGEGTQDEMCLGSLTFRPMPV